MNVLNILKKSPVIFGFFIVTSIVYLIGVYTNGTSTDALFLTYGLDLNNALFYITLFTYPFGHMDFNHFSGNMLMLLLFGIPVERYYGSKKVSIMLLIDTLITGIIHAIVYPDAYMMGASGIVYMMILLFVIPNLKKDIFSVFQVMVVATLVVGEFIQCFFNGLGISNLAHFIGAIFGLIFGIVQKYMDTYKVNA